MIRLYFIALFTIFLLPPSVKSQESDVSVAPPSGTATPVVPKIDETIYDETEEGGNSSVESSDEIPIATVYTSPPASSEPKQLPPTQEAFDDLQQQVDIMEEDIERLLGEQDKLRQKSALDRLNWSGGYRFIFNMYYLDHHLEADNRKEWLAPTWTHRLKLSTSYDFGKSLRFFSQLGVYKYFNETKNTIGAIDHGSNTYPRDNAIRLERVYFDWFVTDWLAVSVGRIASPDGPPTELKENVERQAGWGVQMMNATIDTIMGTFYLGKSHYLRLFYSPFGMHTDYIINSSISLIDDQKVKLLHSWGGILELALPGGEKESIFQLGFLHIPQFPPRDTRVRFPGMEAAIPPVEPKGDNLGHYLAANTLLLFKNIFKSGLDLFAAYGMTMLRPTSGRMVYCSTKECKNSDGKPSSVDMTLGLASYEEGAGTTNVGHTVYAGFRYTLPLAKHYPTRIGGELNWGSKYHLAWSHPSEQLLDKLGNKGIAFEGYIIQQLVPEHLFVRVGYLELKRNHYGQFVGPTSKVNERFRNIHLLVDLAW